MAFPWKTLYMRDFDRTMNELNKLGKLWEDWTENFGELFQLSFKDFVQVYHDIGDYVERTIAYAYDQRESASRPHFENELYDVARDCMIYTDFGCSHDMYADSLAHSCSELGYIELHRNITILKRIRDLLKTDYEANALECFRELSNVCHDVWEKTCDSLDHYDSEILQDTDFLLCQEAEKREVREACNRIRMAMNYRGSSHVLFGCGAKWGWIDFREWAESVSAWFLMVVDSLKKDEFRANPRKLFSLIDVLNEYKADLQDERADGKTHQPADGQVDKEADGKAEAEINRDCPTTNPALYTGTFVKTMHGILSDMVDTDDQTHITLEMWEDWGYKGRELSSEVENILASNLPERDQMTARAVCAHGVCNAVVDDESDYGYYDYDDDYYDGYGEESDHEPRCGDCGHCWECGCPVRGEYDDYSDGYWTD